MGADVFRTKCGHNTVLGPLDHCPRCVEAERQRAIEAAGPPRPVALDSGLMGDDEHEHRKALGAPMRCDPAVREELPPSESRRAGMSHRAAADAVLGALRGRGAHEPAFRIGQPVRVKWRQQVYTVGRVEPGKDGPVYALEREGGAFLSAEESELSDATAQIDWRTVNDGP